MDKECEPLNELTKRVDEMVREDAEKDERRQWHVGKEIPIATILALLLQTAGVVWWAAMIHFKVESMQTAATIMHNLQTNIDRKQDEENAKAEARVLAQLTKISDKLDRVIEVARK